ncbi:MAG: DUF2933 domain-containing protein [Nitrospirae bacterium]|nr:DUF2933 domain-containing protein [Nitrospirota bacterium]
MHTSHETNGRWGLRWGLTLLAFLGIAAFFLLTEHRAHFFGVLPWLLLLAFFVLHFWMHWGRGGRRTHDGDKHTGHRRDKS